MALSKTSAEAIMNHESFVRINIEPSNPKTWAHVFYCKPAHEFVYVLRDHGEKVLYIGITWSAKARWGTHRRKKAWWREVASAEVICRDKGHLALELERELIESLKPKYNIRSVKR